MVYLYSGIGHWTLDIGHWAFPPVNCQMQSEEVQVPVDIYIYPPRSSWSASIRLFDCKYWRLAFVLSSLVRIFSSLITKSHGQEPTTLIHRRQDLCNNPYRTRNIRRIEEKAADNDDKDEE